jgi:hypothetical protein
MSEVVQRSWNWYSRESVQRAILDIAKNREVVSVFYDTKFGKRPDVLNYPGDILQAVAQGTVSFHGSVERWQQPMKLDVGQTKLELDALRIGWDIFIDPDVEDFEIGKIATKQIVDGLKDHGVSNYSIKFTGGKGFHIGIPFESLPEKINMQSTSLLYPDMLQKIIEYLKHYIEDMLREELLALGPPAEISQKIGKPLSSITGKNGLEPFKIISMDIFSSRHLFRLPYSLHEKTLLVSLPVRLEALEKFEREHAAPEKVKVEERFLVPKAVHDAEPLVIEALDWASKHVVEVRQELPKMKVRQTGVVFEEYFPPCIHNILKGLAEGKKRSVFVLINFLRNMGWDIDKMEKKLVEWNQKNYPPLRSNYLRSQLRWHTRQEKSLLPPNCDNPNFYTNYKICTPDQICKGNTENIIIKNPVNYPFRKMKIPGKKKKKKR